MYKKIFIIQTVLNRIYFIIIFIVYSFSLLKRYLIIKIEKKTKKLTCEKNLRDFCGTVCSYISYEFFGAFV